MPSRKIACLGGGSLHFTGAIPDILLARDLREMAGRYRRFAHGRGFLFSGGWRSKSRTKGNDKDGGAMEADALLWLCGGENAICLAMTERALVQAWKDVG